MNVRWTAVVALLGACGDNGTLPFCEGAHDGVSRPVGTRTVVGTLPGVASYGDMVVTTTHAYVVANNGSQRSIRRIALATGASDVVTTIDHAGADTMLRRRGDVVAWNDGAQIAMLTPSGTTRLDGVPGYTTLGDFDFDMQHVFVATGGRQLVALALDGTVAASWPVYSFAVQADGNGGALLANCTMPGLWRVQVGAELDPVPAPPLCAFGLVSADGVSLVTAYSDCGEYGVYRVDPQSGAATTLVRGGPKDEPETAFLRTDADEAYYIAGGSLLRVPVDGGEPLEVLAGARAFALGENEIVAIAGDQLVRIAKAEK